MNRYIKRIADLRDERGWTNNRMSIEAGIGSATVINWFARNATPKLDAIEMLCFAFGITMSEFFNNEEDLESLSEIQTEFLSEFDCLNMDEKQKLLDFVKSLNTTRRKYNV